VRDERGATSPRKGTTVRLRPTNLDSTLGRLGEHPSWVVGEFRVEVTWHDGAGWKAFPTRASRAKMIDSLRRFAEVEFEVLPADTRFDNRTCSVFDDDESGGILGTERCGSG
jgi:hypothetical protein